MTVVGIAVFEVIADVLKICGGGRPTDAHLRAEHLLQACVHFFFFNELTPVGLRNAYPDGGTEAGIFLKQAQSGFLHQSLGVGACLGGDLQKLRFLFGGEMDFHRLQNKARPSLTQQLGSKR
jgi:hypothetical protein